METDDARAHRNRRLAPASQRRGADINLARFKRRQLGGIDRISDARGLPSIALPTYPNLHLAVPNRREIGRRIEAARPDAIHLATEGPILLPPAPHSIHVELYDALSGIHFCALSGP